MKLKSILIILLSMLSLTAFAQQKKVAVYVTGQQTDVNKVLGDKLVEAFAKSGKYIAIERTASFLAELGKEQNYQRTGAVDDNELSRLGKQFGVQLVCVADISEVFGQKYVSARLIDVESAEVVNTSNTNSNLSSIDELLKVSQKLATELTSQTVQEKAEAAAQKEKELAEEKKRLEQAITDGYMQVDNIMFVVTYSPPVMFYVRAKDAAREFQLGGFSDWRLPTIVEMSRIIDVCEMYHSINPHFPCYRDSYGCANNCFLEVGNYNKIQGHGWLSGSYQRSVIYVRDVPAN